MGRTTKALQQTAWAARNISHVLDRHLSGRTEVSLSLLGAEGCPIQLYNIPSSLFFYISSSQIRNVARVKITAVRGRNPLPLVVKDSPGALVSQHSACLWAEE